MHDEDGDEGVVGGGGAGVAASEGGSGVADEAGLVPSLPEESDPKTFRSKKPRT